MRNRTAKAAAPDPSLAFCEVLEQEYTELTREAPDEAPPWEFAPNQILEPERLASRLIKMRDRASRALRDQLLSGVLEELKSALASQDYAALADILAKRLNLILRDPELYDPNDPTKLARFAGVRFRSQTLD